MNVFDEMVDFVKEANPGRKFIVPCLEGPPGIGKTAACKQAATELQEEGCATGKVVTIIASQILPNEVSGITMPVVESKAMEIFDHFRLSSLKDGDVLFFDELLEADELVLKACLTLIESRELMSGRKLPDIMIVAATNPSIKPNMLEENIRQRFVWRRFGIDKEGTRNYIKKLCGFDPGDIVEKMTSTGEDYNILTPRSLTKMCQWIACVEDDNKRKAIANNINMIWNSNLGTNLYSSYMKAKSDQMSQLYRSVITAMREANVNEDSIQPELASVIASDSVFKECSMTELMEMLQQLPEWKAIEKSLANMNMVQIDIGNEVTF